MKTKTNKQMKHQRQKEEGTSRKLVGIELLEKGIARKEYPIVDKDGNKIGMVTSGTMSPTLNKAIAMGYVATECSSVNSEVYIKIRTKQIKSKIVSLPFVK